MNETLAASPLEIELAEYGEQLRRFLDRVPVLLRRGQVAALRGECGQLVEQAPAHQDERWTRVYESLCELRTALDSDEPRAEVLTQYDEAARAYEHWIGPRKNLGSLKPLKFARTGFHIFTGMLGVVMYQFVLTRWQAAAIVTTIFSVFASLEIARRLLPRFNDMLLEKVFAPIARPNEYYKVNASTYFVLSLCLLVPFFSRPSVLLGLVILSFADPAAAWFGKTYGKRKIFREKSLVGALAFFAVAAVSASIFMLACYPTLPLSNRLLASVLAALVGAVTELFTTVLDDNLTIPIATTLTAALFI